MNLKGVVSIGSRVMGLVGWKKTAKSCGWSSGTVLVVGVLVNQCNIPFKPALALGAIITGAINGLYQYLRKYEYVGGDEPS